MTPGKSRLGRPELIGAFLNGRCCSLPLLAFNGSNWHLSNKKIEF
jgi:hypothetical protein